ncbi:beta-ketoacyl-[acyl-carrier-protein] synthase family protein [Halodesulfovibrio marinisediminis]|uniref:3-oxoacyl-[acyl-carrier-protein] synthase II n=1 Tax=Halodesulfovibrio marinisediminis DSM 17456 TaxID=1121457 RepID=A0A1N6IR57_9BACT|nr:beta-ketoacyl-[acyl-carrier-protein] synthase family protein [Halodesulfovibrio marinisediminis]SIO34501.1 3-oxoacyl-[acyl-carrier-protein] synthase II [Halodesulfovibrio marinisediminis DSM 17456]
MRNRVVITGTGYITSLGSTSEEIMDAVRQNKPAFAASHDFEECVDCPVQGFDLTASTGRWKNKKYLSRSAQLALAAAIRAAENSGVTTDVLNDAGLFVGTGPNFDISSDFPNIENGNMDSVDLAALWMLRYLPNTAASAISQFLNIHGENSTIGTACSASTQAIGEAFRKIKDGYLTVALAGGGDSRISHGGMLAYKKAQAIWNKGGNPNKACRPFDTERSGFVAGEGGAMFILESLEHAQARGAHIIAEICGYGATMDAHTMTAPHPEAVHAEKAVRSAISEAEMTPEDINLIAAHGTSTPLNDQMEATMLERIFYSHNEKQPCVTAVKSWVGHCTAASGAVELSVLLTLLSKGVVPPVRNLTSPCSDKINFTTKSTQLSGKNILLENFGFGGQNSALIVRLWS